MPDRAEALDFITSNVKNPPSHTFISFSNGSHSSEKGAGAANVEYNFHDPPNSQTLSVRVGNAEETTPYQAELTGFELAVGNASANAPQGTLFLWFFTDNQTLIRDITETLRAKPGMTTCLSIRWSLNKIILRHPGSTAAVLWCPSKKDIQGLEIADTAAKAAYSLPQVIETSSNPHVISKKIKQQLASSVASTPPFPKHTLDRLMGFYNPVATYKALAKLPRPEATAVAQLLSGHCPLNAYLHRFKASDNPDCNLCNQHEDVCHLLTACRKFVGIRRALFNTTKRKPRQTVSTSPPIWKSLNTWATSYRSPSGSTRPDTANSSPLDLTPGHPLDPPIAINPTTDLPPSPSPVSTPYIITRPQPQQAPTNLQPPPL